MAVTQIPARASGTGTVETVFITAWVRNSWSAGFWQFAPYLTPVAASVADLHGQSSARFKFSYGEVSNSDVLGYTTRLPRGDRNLYVCIKSFSPLVPALPVTLWVGVIPAEELVMLGTRAFVAAGDQYLTAYGLEYLLERRSLTTTPVVISQPVGGDTVLAMINRVPAFNRATKSGMHLEGNRSAGPIVITGTPTVPDTYGFANGGEVWYHKDVIDHLLTWTDSFTGSDPEPHFTFTAPGGLLTYLSGRRSVVDAEGRNVLSILRELLSRKRGLSAVLRWSEDTFGWPEGDIEIAAVSLSDTDVAFAGRTLPGNTNTTDLVVDTDPNVSRASVKVDQVQAYDEIIAKGGPLVTCFSTSGAVTAAALNLAEHRKAWSDAVHTAYEGASDAQRRLEQYDRVFRMFSLGREGEEFDWLTKGGSPIPLNPAVAGDGTVSATTNAVTGNMDIRLLDTLPFPKAADTVQEVGTRRFEKPFALVEILDPDTGAGTGLYIDASNPPEADEAYEAGLDVPGGDTHSATVTAQDRNLEIEVRFQKAAHVLGANNFTPGEGFEPAVEAVFDYKKMILTVAAEMDYRPQAVRATGIAAWFTNRKLIISVADAHIWVVATGTIAGINADGTLLYYSGPRVVRNDMAIIREVAETAAVFFGRERATLELTRQGIHTDLGIGVFVRHITQGYLQADIATAVSGVAYDFVHQATTVRTSHAHLEFGG